MNPVLDQEQLELELQWRDFVNNHQPANQTCITITSDTITNQYNGNMQTIKKRCLAESNSSDTPPTPFDGSNNAACFQESSPQFRRDMQLAASSVKYPIPVMESCLKSSLHFSTKTQLVQLNAPIDRYEIFWNLQNIDYSDAREGIVQRRINFASETNECVKAIQTRAKNLEANEYVTTHVSSHIDNPTGKIKFMDKRSINIGISKDNIYTKRRSKRGEFFNCMAVIVRMKVEGTFREFHVKLFDNEVEIPGAKNDDIYSRLIDIVLSEIRRMNPTKYATLSVVESTRHIVIVNTDFRFHKFLRQPILLDVLKYKYSIHAIYDPCCYHPGIRCKFYHDSDAKVQTGIRPSYMPADISKKKGRKNNSIAKRVAAPPNITTVSIIIFRTGSVLISGKCKTDDVLHDAFNFILGVLQAEEKIVAFDDPSPKHEAIKRAPVKKRRHKRVLMVDTQHTQQK